MVVYSRQHNTGEQRHYSDLVNDYSSVDGILQCKYAPALAYAMDMKQEDYHNLMIKQFAYRKGIQEQPLTIRIDGEDVDLDIKGRDILMPRSGPVFSGHDKWSQEAANLFLEGGSTPARAQKIQQQIVATASYTHEKGIPLPEPEMLKNACSIFDMDLAAQRRLGDFDLKLGDFEMLKQAINKAYIKKTGEEIPPYLIEEVAKTAWEYGGEIKSEHIEAIKNYESDSYSKLVGVDIKKQNPPYHMLTASFGPKLAEYGFKISAEQTSVGRHDIGYGVAIVFEGAEVREYLQGSGKYAKTTDIYREYEEGKISTEDAIKILGKKGFEYKGLYELCDTISKDGKRLLPSAIEREHPEIYTASDIAEEAGAKLALRLEQSRSGVDQKMIKTSSDTFKHLTRLEALADQGNAKAAALLQAAQFSFITKSSYWGVEQANLKEYMQRGHFACGDKKLSDQDYQSIINENSYSHPEGTGIREELGWSNISQTEARKRMEAYEKAAQPLHDFALDNAEYYQHTKLLKSALTAYRQSEQDLLITPAELKEQGMEADAIEQYYHDKLDNFYENEKACMTQRENMYKYMEQTLVQKAPELNSLLMQQGEQARDQFVENAMQQAAEGIEFNLTREQSKSQGQNVDIGQSLQEMMEERGYKYSGEGTLGEVIQYMLKQGLSPQEVAANAAEADKKSFSEMIKRERERERERKQTGVTYEKTH